jgi:4-amino-4-deoxy-L-arabinose transferase-like glycosyltransferase
VRLYAAAKEAPTTTPAQGSVLLGWAALGLGILVKGPVAPAVCVATVAVLCLWDRDAGWLRDLQPLRGLLVVAVIVAPWAIAIAVETHGRFYAEALGTDFAAKLTGGQETHGAPPGYYLILASLTLWPATLFAVPGLREGMARHKEAPVRFLLAWAAAVWVIFEATPTKLPHYILPAYPAICLLGAIWASRAQTTDRLASVWRLSAVVQFLLGLAVLIGGLVFMVSRFGDGVSGPLLGVVLASLLAGLVAASLLARRQVHSAATAAVISAWLLYAGMTAVAVPSLNQLWVSARLATMVAQNSHPGDAPPALAGFDEPSLVFRLGSATRLTDGRGAADALASTGGLAGVEVQEGPAFLARLLALHARAAKVGEVSGFNYSRGRVVRVAVYRVLRAR